MNENTDALTYEGFHDGDAGRDGDVVNTLPMVGRLIDDAVYAAYVGALLQDAARRNLSVVRKGRDVVVDYGTRDQERPSWDDVDRAWETRETLRNR